MKKYLFLVLLVLSFFMYSCGLDTGINTLDKATTELLKVSGELTDIVSRLDNDKNTPIVKVDIEDELEEIRNKLDELNKYVKVDSKFSERYANVEKRLEEVEKRQVKFN